METSKDIKDIKFQGDNKDPLKKEPEHKLPEFVVKNAKYLIAAVIFVIMIIVAAFFLKQEDQETGVQYSADGVEMFEVDAYPAVMSLIEQYYACYAAGDFDTLQTLAAPFSEHELAYMTLLSQYVESYQNMVFYTKSGLDADSYLVNVYLEMKFEGVETLAPGLDFFYVSAREDGTLYIDNSYSEYNMKNNDNPINVEVHSLITEHEQHADLIELLTDTSAKFSAAIEADPNLAVMVNETIPEATSAWMASVIQGNTSAVPETEISGTETPSTEISETTVPESEVQGSETLEPESEEPQPESEATQPDSDVISFAEGTVIRLEGATKVREGMSTEADVVATLYKGDKVTVVMSYAEGWTKVTWNNKTGYIRSDLLQ